MPILFTCDWDRYSSTPGYNHLRKPMPRPVFHSKRSLVSDVALRQTATSFRLRACVDVKDLRMPSGRQITHEVQFGKNRGV